jgi:hypothetical protein
MAHARTAASLVTATRVQVIAPASLGATAIAALRARGIDAQIATVPADDHLVAWALDTTPTATAAVELAAVCARAAAQGRPVCLLAPQPRGSGRAAIERAAALAYLRAHGAAVGHDVDAWLESIVLLVRFGLPAGATAAVIAPPGSWLEAQVLGVVVEADALGTRAPSIGDDDPTDVVLYDPSLGQPPPTTRGLAIPVIARGELGDAAALYGVRAALGAAAVLGRAAERIAIGLGPAPVTASAELGIDRERLERQLGNLHREPSRVGDHETKVLLAAYGVPITRQAVATTPSAAVKLARRAGYPVELKPFGNQLPTEPAGCPVERDLTSDAHVRQAFAALMRVENYAGMIVRETPPAGRELAVSLLKLPALGWTVVLETPNHGHIAAAPAPLRLVDAQSLAAQVVASRAGDPEPDRTGLANLLRRVSHLVVDHGARLVRVELPRVIVGGRGSRTLVVDAYADLA